MLYNILDFARDETLIQTVKVEISGAIGKKPAFAGMNDEVGILPVRIAKERGYRQKQAGFLATPSQAGMLYSS